MSIRILSVTHSYEHFSYWTVQTFKILIYIINNICARFHHYGLFTFLEKTIFSVIPFAVHRHALFMNTSYA